MTALYAMTPNPECEVCSGSGTDPVFFGDCTECWPNARLTHQREELWHARRQQWAIEAREERPTRPVRIVPDDPPHDWRAAQAAQHRRLNRTLSI